MIETLLLSKPDLFVSLPELSLCRAGGRGAYLHCTAGSSSRWHRSTHRGLGDRTRRTCIPLVHYTVPYKFCQMCAVRKLFGGEEGDSELSIQPFEMHNSSLIGSLLDH